MGLVLFQWLAPNKGFSILKIRMDRVCYCSPPCFQPRHPAPCEPRARVPGDRGSASVGDRARSRCPGVHGRICCL